MGPRWRFLLSDVHFLQISKKNLSSPTQTAPILCLSPVERRIATAGLGRGAAAQAVVQGGEAVAVAAADAGAEAHALACILALKVPRLHVARLYPGRADIFATVSTK